MKTSARPSTAIQALTFVVAALPVIFLAYLVRRYGVSVPALDDWEMAPLIEKARLGGLTFHDFFVQQQESRTFFPKLIFLLLASGHHWDVRAEMALSIVLCCLTAIGIYCLLRKSGLSAVATAVSFCLIVLLIFSPVQHELWLLASGFPSFIPVLCIVAGLVVTQTKLSPLVKFILCAALAFFSSFSLAGGLLAWGLTFPVFCLTNRSRRWKLLAGAWLIVTAIAAAIYFWEYRAQADLPKFAPAAIAPLDYAKYFLAFLGSGLARAGNEHPFRASIAVGAGLLGIFTALFGYTCVRLRDRDFLARVAPWFALGLYSLGSGCLAALGRIEYGVAQSLESRYVAFSLYLTVAVIALVPIVRAEILQAPRSNRTRSILFAATFGLTAACLMFELFCGIASIAPMKMRSAWGRLGRGAVLFSQAFDTSATIKSANFPRPQFVRANADALDRLHLLRPGLIRTARLKELRQGVLDGVTVCGWLDGIAPAGSDRLSAWGWAMLKSKGRSADCVVVAYATEGEDWIAFAISDDVRKREDVSGAQHDENFAWAGWASTFPKNAVPAGAKISAWAVDAAEAKLYRLKESVAPSQREATD